MKPWMWPALASGIGIVLMCGSLACAMAGIWNWWPVVMLGAGGPLAMTSLFVPAEGPFWRAER